MKILFATANQHKVDEVQRLLGDAIEIITPAQTGYTDDIPETGNTLEENARQKARHIYERCAQPCFADDTGLEIDALGGAPGVYSARYAGDGKDSQANMRRVLKELHGVSHRAARFRCVIVLIAASREYVFEGRVDGEIITEERGTQGFGYDPIFRPEGYPCTFAEMPVEEKNRLSHRGKAVEQLVAFLQKAEILNPAP
ncbi:MAG: RdgB/HAM1 family non-canonical purine NTP pyrophosphatase [Prevotellaceae bacterium]|jgi:XTP/dITP diphosphohydrolase|nr:RdgB/HAM1 family non-canonical purine NTP pyrophosphatase [Prevotellaceae bacterium]